MKLEDIKKITEAMNMSFRISCCPDKSEYAYAVLNALDNAKININDVPLIVIKALHELQNWEEAEPNCNIVNSYLQKLLTEFDIEQKKRL